MTSVRFGHDRPAVSPFGAGITFFPRPDGTLRSPNPYGVSGQVVAFPRRAALQPEPAPRPSAWSRLHALLDLMETAAKERAKRRAEIALRRADEARKAQPVALPDSRPLWL